MKSPNDRPSPSKRPRTEATLHNGEVQHEEELSMFCLFQKLLLNGSATITQDKPVQINPPLLPKSLLQVGQLRNIISKWRNLFNTHGFRTSLISSPRQGLSVYKDSFLLGNTNKTEAHGDNSTLGRLFLGFMFALHPHQEEAEKCYERYFQHLYTLFLFCQRMRQVSRKDGDQLEGVIGEDEKLLCCFLLPSTSNYSNVDRLKRLAEVSASIPSRIPNLLQAIHNTHPRRHRIEVLEHEYQRIRCRTSTLSNALITFFQTQHQSSIDSMVFKASPQMSKYERIAIYLYDVELDHKKPSHFLFLPSLHKVLTKDLDTIVDEMLEYFWSQILSQGYYATSALKGMLHSDLSNFFGSGLTGSLPLPLFRL